MIESKHIGDSAVRDPFIGRSILLDILSRAFAYPEPDFYRELVDGGLLEKLTQGCLLIDTEHAFEKELNDVAAAFETVSDNHTHEELEADYIALFEVNRNLPPLHLNSGLYQKGKNARLETLQRLAGLYHEQGLTMEQGAEQADHLTVETEFLAYLYRCLADSPQADTGTAKEVLLQRIDTLSTELAWVDSLAGELERRGNHPLYVSLGRLLAAVVAQSH